MRIGKTDFEVGNVGRVHQAVLDAVPNEEAIEESELRAAYDKVKEADKPPFEQVMKNMSHLLTERRLDGRTFYRKRVWLSSAEVARRLEVSMRTVQSWGQKGVMGARYVGDRLRFAAEQVDEWVRGRRGGEATAQPGSSTPTQVWDNDKDAQYDRL